MRFSVSVNSEQLCIAGLRENGCLQTFVSYSRTNTESRLTRDGDPEDVELSVFGFESEHFPAGKIGKLLVWNNSALKVGDEVLIRILDDGQISAPNRVEQDAEI